MNAIHFSSRCWFSQTIERSIKCWYLCSMPPFTGMYLCKHSDSFIAPVYIEVVFKEPIVKVTPKNYTKYQVKPLSPLIRNLNVFIKWENWSPCSACDIVGKKLRLGYCYVYQENNEIFRLFEDGVPCRSQLLNDEIKADPNVQSNLLNISSIHLISESWQMI